MAFSTTCLDTVQAIFGKARYRYLTTPMLMLYAHIPIYYNIFEFEDHLNRRSGNTGSLSFYKELPKLTSLVDRKSFSFRMMIPSYDD